VDIGEGAGPSGPSVGAPNKAVHLLLSQLKPHSRAYSQSSTHKPLSAPLPPSPISGHYSAPLVVSALPPLPSQLPNPGCPQPHPLNLGLSTDGHRPPWPSCFTLPHPQGAMASALCLDPMPCPTFHSCSLETWEPVWHTLPGLMPDRWEPGTISLGHSVPWPLQVSELMLKPCHDFGLWADLA
jgi:hypothetical protein